jgi:hypothetical protein
LGLIGLAPWAYLFHGPSWAGPAGFWTGPLKNFKKYIKKFLKIVLAKNKEF